MSKRAEIVVGGLVGAVIGAVLSWFVQPVLSALSPASVPILGQVWARTGDVRDGSPDVRGRVRTVEVRTGFPINGTQLVLFAVSPNIGGTYSLAGHFPQSPLEYMDDWNKISVKLGGRRVTADNKTAFEFKVCRVKGAALVVVNSYFQLVTQPLPEPGDEAYGTDPRFTGIDFSGYPREDLICSGDRALLTRHN